VDALVSRRAVLNGAIALGVSVAFGAGLRLDSPAPGAWILSSEELAILRAVAIVMFPGDPLPIDGIDAGVAEEVDRLLVDLMGEPQASAFRYVLRALEWGTFASRGARFSQLDPHERGEVLDAWSDPAILPRRVASDGIRLLVGMAYFRNTVVLDAIGWRVDCRGRQ
jgi:hypothetical protein